MLKEITDNLWHLEHHFSLRGVPYSSRMTVVRLNDGRLCLHSPVPISRAVEEHLRQLGVVSFILAPSKKHHRFVAECAALFPEAAVFGAPGLMQKREDIAGLQEIPSTSNPAWWPELECFLFNGIPSMNEMVWFHRASATLILSDLCQWWRGELPFLARCYASLNGVRKQMAVPNTVQMSIHDHFAARLSAERILQWPYRRVITAHNVILENHDIRKLGQALASFRRN
ncbi:DUF4336 domain-containing protein [Undibacterium sp.]|uniref:DUF4336 domain-containing protein n=1 Tax=Undibacterium sp. TaxID=1914977 RepID=UPI0025E2774F|nr:DUF4336 domain-containing protein [Undibacterium sp.]